MKSKGLVYTRKSVFTQSKPNNSKYLNSLYGGIFIEDMCSDFAIRFAPAYQSRNFFTVNPNDSKLKSFLEYKTHQFLQYELSKQLSQNMYNLLVNGVCYAEIVLGFEEKELKSISFVPLNINKCVKKRYESKFYAIDHRGNKVSWILPNNLIVKFDLKDLGMKRWHFRKMLKGLSRKKLPDFEWQQKMGISISDYDNRQVLNALKLVGDTYWNLRKSSNEYTTDIYLLYRDVKHKAYRLKFLDYLISKYNNALENLGLEYDFTGEIAYCVDIKNHVNALKRLLSGEINCEEMGKCLFKYH